MATCKKCGSAIDFRMTDAGKWQPIDPETGEVHYGECKRIALGEKPNYFAGAAKMQDMPQFHPVSGRMMYSDGARSIGKVRKIPTPCCPDVPPWDLCEHQISGEAVILKWGKL